MITYSRASQSLGYEFGQKPFTVDNTYYLGLCNADPSSTADRGEPSYSTGYRRVEINNTYNTSGNYAESWVMSGTELCIANRNTLEFPTITAECSTANYWFLCTNQITSTSSDLGTLLYYGTLASPRALPANTKVSITAGQMKIYRTNPA